MYSNRQMNKRLIFTGGGTAGHVYPGLSVIESLRKKNSDIEILWIGSSLGMEKEIVLKAGVEFKGIPSGKLRRYFSLRNFTDLFKIAAGMIKAAFIIKLFKPDIVFSKGGFVSVPPVIAAGLQKIPVYSHESDLTPGLATKLNMRFSEKILVSYKQTKAYIPTGKAVLTGNPVRAAVMNADRAAGRRAINAADKPVIIVLGGSQGALQVNRLIEELIPEFEKAGCIVIHQTGKHAYDGYRYDGYIRREYITDELPDLIAASDLVISRAGASTLWENAALGKPSILIPLGTGASRGDQQKNAGIFAEAGAAVVLSGEVTAAQLSESIRQLLDDPERREIMSKNAFKLVNGNPADIISDKLIERIS